MARSDYAWLEDIADACVQIAANIQDHDRTTLRLDVPKNDSVLFRFIVIGEAAKQMSEVMREKIIGVHWPDVISL